MGPNPGSLCAALAASSLREAILNARKLSALYFRAALDQRLLLDVGA